jgi:hypothetical protein
MWKCFAPQVPLLNTLINGHCVNGKEGFACKLALHFFVVPGDVCHIRFLGTYITMQHGTVYASIICFPVPKCNVRLLLLNALPHLPHPIAMCSPDANTGKYLTVLLNNLAVIEMLYILAVLPPSPLLVVKVFTDSALFALFRLKMSNFGFFDKNSKKNRSDLDSLKHLERFDSTFAKSEKKFVSWHFLGSKMSNFGLFL